MRRARDRTPFAFAVCVTAAGCGAVLGYDDIAYTVAPSDATSADATDESDASTEDAADDGQTLDAAASPCVDTSSDPKHCGQCGHDCLGGACSDARCEPFTLVDATSPSQLVMDDDNVYFVNREPDGGDHVERAPKAGGAATRVTEDETSILHIALDAPYVYFSGYNSVQRRRLDLGAPAEYVFPYDARFLAGAFAFVGLDVWVVRPEAGYQAFVCPKEPAASASASCITTGGVGFDYPTTVAATKNGVFVGDTTYVRRMARPDDYAEVAAGPVAHAVADDQHLWFTQPGSLSVVRIALDAPPLGSPDAGGVTTFGPGGGPGGELALDATHVYWLTTGASGFLHRLARPSGPVETVVSDVRRGAGLAVDTKRLCWAERDLGRIQCLAK